MKLITFFLVITIVLESTLITLPLSLLIIIFASIVIRKNDVFILAFFSGLFLDVLRLGTIGISSAYFVTIVMAIFVYQKKFEITSLHFISIVALIGALGYLFLAGTNYIVVQALTSALFMAASFFVFKKTNKKARSAGSTSSLQASSGQALKYA